MGITFCQWRWEASRHRSRMSGQHIQIHGLEDEAPKRRLPDPRHWLLSHAELNDWNERDAYQGFETPHTLEGRIVQLHGGSSGKEGHATPGSALPGSLTIHGRAIGILGLRRRLRGWEKRRRDTIEMMFAMLNFCMVEGEGRKELMIPKR